MKGDGFFFLGILIFLFVVWLASGGPSRPISFSGPYLHPITRPNTKAEAYGTPTDTKKEDKETRSNVQKNLKEIQEQIDDLRLFGNSSPYRDIVKIQRSTSGVRTQRSREERIEISVSSRAKESINVSGWRLVSLATGSSVRIPEGTELPKTGSVNEKNPILLAPGDRAIITSGRSPIGTSFRENQCMGYFEEFQDFYPSLSLSCPDPLKDFDQFYPGNPLEDDECYEFIDDVYGKCEMATSTKRSLSSACRTYLTKYVNYNGCVLVHGADKNFMKNRWRIFLGSDRGLWKDERDTIKLLDTEGRTVDVFAY